MARKRSKVSRRSAAERVLESHEATILDLLDHVLNQGVMATGDVTLGVAGIDLIYLRLSALLCAADRVMPEVARSTSANRRHRKRRLGPR
jgi:hypothetical protein